MEKRHAGTKDAAKLVHSLAAALWRTTHSLSGYTD
jgi:hypothetical protein